jgi:hypothetical protein
MSLFAPEHRRRMLLLASLVLTPLLLLTAVLLVYQSQAQASSHREAPLISKDTFADSTDVYMFISPENANNVVFVGSWIPFEAPEGGPNYFEWDPTALYDIYVDNDGDAIADITYTLSSQVAVQNPDTFLYNTGLIGQNGENSPAIHHRHRTDRSRRVDRAGRQQAGRTDQHRQQIDPEL